MVVVIVVVTAVLVGFVDVVVLVIMVVVVVKVVVVRETVPSLTLDKWRKTVSVLAHLFLLPQRDSSGYILSISPLRYSRS